jgi:hypothetical protein
MDLEEPTPDTTLTENPEPAPAPVGYDLNANVAGGVKKVRWNMLAVIDFMLSNPMAKNADIAAQFGYTQGWISRIISSDAFANKFIARKKELFPDEDFVMAVQETEERFRALANESLARLQEKLPGMDTEQLLKTAEMASKAQGFGVAKGAQTNVSIQQSYVVALPEKAKSADEWMQKHGRLPVTIEAEPASGV